MLRPSVAAREDKMRRILIAAALALTVAACGQNSDFGGGEMAAMEEAEMFADAAPAPMVAQSAREYDDSASEVATSDGTSATQSISGQPTPQLFLAYSYNVGLRLPSEGLVSVMDAHVKTCLDAGPRFCQLIGSSRSGDPDSYMNGYVSLRGEPAWLRGFMNGLETQADEAGGRIVSQSTSTEDLTRAIVDTEARLRAMTTLRDRLQGLLSQRRADLSDLLEVERELARVQGEIDSTQSNLAVMRTRVAMSELTLSYESAPRSVGSDTFEPLGRAFANFLGLIVQGIAAIVTLVAVLLPWAIVAALVIWGLLVLRKKRGGRFIQRQRESAPRAPAAQDASDNPDA